MDFPCNQNVSPKPFEKREAPTTHRIAKLLVSFRFGYGFIVGGSMSLKAGNYFELNPGSLHSLVSSSPESPGLCGDGKMDENWGSSDSVYRISSENQGFTTLSNCLQATLGENAEVSMDVSLAYRDDMFAEWTEMAHERVPRKLKCTFTSPKTAEHEGRYYECDVLPFMEIGSVAHKYYLLNIRLPVNEKKKINVGIGEIKDIRLVGIHQNGGFTKVWFAMKTFLTPSIFIIMVWYWRRITMMSRPPVLLEKVIFALGISMTFINIPVEWFSIGFDWTWMLLGVQLTNPFYSIWTTDVGTELAVFRNISGKQSSLSAMSKVRRLHYEGLIFRFKFLMLITLACAAMTVIFFIVSQVTEGHWKWGGVTVQVNSAFFTGIYGMWNLYVFALMFLYAPSHKNYGEDQSNARKGQKSTSFHKVAAQGVIPSHGSSKLGSPIIFLLCSLPFSSLQPPPDHTMYRRNYGAFVKILKLLGKS
eukprot:bmy_13601T0